MNSKIRPPITESTIHDYLEKLEPLQAAFDLISDHVVITDKDGMILYANKAVEKNTGYSLNEIIGKNPGDLWGGLMPKEFYEKMWKAIKDEKRPFVEEVKNKRKDGTEYWQEVHISPVLNEAGEIQFFIGIEPNITDRKKKEKFREEFVSIIGHQVRDPLATIRWTLEWLLDTGALGKDERLAIETMYEKNQGLVSLIGDLLILSRVEKGSRKNEHFDLASELETLIEDVKERHPRVSFTFTKSEKEFPVHTDKSLALQVFSNIIANAAEYSEMKSGKILVSLSKADATYIFNCVDNGIGIPKEDQQKIFTHFFRASNATKLSGTGTGLGLSIVKMIVDSLGWKISFMSEQGKGTTFCVTIPL